MVKSGEEEFCLHQYNNNVAKIAYTVSGPPAPCILSLCPLYPVPMPPVSCPHNPCILPLFPDPVSSPYALLYPVPIPRCILSLCPPVSCPYAHLFPPISLAGSLSITLSATLPGIEAAAGIVITGKFSLRQTNPPDWRELWK